MWSNLLEKNICVLSLFWFMCFPCSLFFLFVSRWRIQKIYQRFYFLLCFSFRVAVVNKKKKRKTRFFSLCPFFGANTKNRKTIKRSNWWGSTTLVSHILTTTLHLDMIISCPIVLLTFPPYGQRHGIVANLLGVSVKSHGAELSIYLFIDVFCMIHFQNKFSKWSNLSDLWKNT